MSWRKQGVSERESRVHAAARGVILEGPYVQDTEIIHFTFPQFIYFLFLCILSLPQVKLLQ